MVLTLTDSIETNYEIAVKRVTGRDVRLCRQRRYPSWVSEKGHSVSNYLVESIWRQAYYGEPRYFVMQNGHVVVDDISYGEVQQMVDFLQRQ